jgi:hypothetical protein
VLISTFYQKEFVLKDLPDARINGEQVPRYRGKSEKPLYR